VETVISQSLGHFGIELARLGGAEFTGDSGGGRIIPDANARPQTLDASTFLINADEGGHEASRLGCFGKGSVHVADGGKAFDVQIGVESPTHLPRLDLVDQPLHRVIREGGAPKSNKYHLPSFCAEEH